MAKTLSDLKEEIVRLEWKMKSAKESLENDKNTSGIMTNLKVDFSIFSRFPSSITLSVVKSLYPSIYKDIEVQMKQDVKEAQVKALGMTVEEYNLELLASRLGTFDVLNRS